MMLPTYKKESKTKKNKHNDKTDMGNSMPNQHQKMSTPSDFHETQEICSLPQGIMSHTIWYLDVVWLLNYRAVKV